VDAVLTAFYYNVVVFAFLMASYECLRRLLPAVYSSKKRLQFVRPGHPDEDDEGDLDDHHSHGRRAQFLNNAASSLGDQPYLQHRVPESNTEDQCTEASDNNVRKDHHESLSSLPDNRLFDWIAPVFGVSWNQVRKQAGLDGYFFLRYIRMCVRITTVSTGQQSRTCCQGVVPFVGDEYSFCRLAHVDASAIQLSLHFVHHICHEARVSAFSRDSARFFGAGECSRQSATSLLAHGGEHSIRNAE